MSWKFWMVFAVLLLLTAYAEGLFWQECRQTNSVFYCVRMMSR